ncbi:hypothetical protein Bca4012_021004 [Brassica carinata]
MGEINFFYGFCDQGRDDKSWWFFLGGVDDLEMDEITRDYDLEKEITRAMLAV